MISDDFTMESAKRNKSNLKLYEEFTRRQPQTVSEKMGKPLYQRHYKEECGIMIHLIVQALKYLMVFLFLVYTLSVFHVFKFLGEEEEQNIFYHVQRTLLFLSF